MTEGHKETFGGDRYVCYLDCDDGIMVYKYVKLIKLYTFDLGSFYYKPFISQ